MSPMSAAGLILLIAARLPAQKPGFWTEMSFNCANPCGEQPQPVPLQVFVYSRPFGAGIRQEKREREKGRDGDKKVNFWKKQDFFLQEVKRLPNDCAPEPLSHYQTKRTHTPQHFHQIPAPALSTAAPALWGWNAPRYVWRADLLLTPPPEQPLLGLASFERQPQTPCLRLLIFQRPHNLR